MGKICPGTAAVSQAAAIAEFTAAINVAKANDTKIFVIAVAVPDNSFRNVLKGLATSEAYYFEADFSTLEAKVKDIFTCHIPEGSCTP